MRRWCIALALLVSLAPTAYARSIHARIEGPGPDGLTYTVRMDSADENASFEPWGTAWGLVDGKLKTVLLRLQTTSEHGVYRFTRAWPQEGRWMIALSPGHPPAPATVASLRADGTVKNNKFYFHTDGIRECARALMPGRGEGC